MTLNIRQTLLQNLLKTMTVYWALDYLISFEEKDRQEKKSRTKINKANSKTKTKITAKITRSPEKKKKK